jgi:hypothetical protein
MGWFPATLALVVSRDFGPGVHRGLEQTGNMTINCLECTRLLQESNDALKSHTEMLGRIYGSILCTDHATAVRMESEPDVLAAADLRKSTRRIFDDHQDVHKELDRAAQRRTKNM